jgi:hypothetical protein
VNLRLKNLDEQMSMTAGSAGAIDN